MKAKQKQILIGIVLIFSLLALAGQALGYDGTEDRNVLDLPTGTESNPYPEPEDTRAPRASATVEPYPFPPAAQDTPTAALTCTATIPPTHAPTPTEGE